MKLPTVAELLSKVPPGYERDRPWYEYLSAEDQEVLKAITAGLFAPAEQAKK